MKLKEKKGNKRKGKERKVSSSDEIRIQVQCRLGLKPRVGEN